MLAEPFKRRRICPVADLLSLMKLNAKVVYQCLIIRHVRWTLTERDGIDGFGGDAVLL